MTDLNVFFAKQTLKEAYTEERGQFLSALMQSAREGHLCVERTDAPELPASLLEEGPIVRQGNRYYLQRNWVLESHILEQIERLRRVQFPSRVGEPIGALLPMQQKAVDHAFVNALSIICGGPGTGKTYTAAAIVRAVLAENGKARAVIAAPTGKAASHFASLLGDRAEATTLHRLLRIAPGNHRLFSGWKIDADLVLVDEASMLDAPLLAKLLESIGEKTRLVLMGDPDQLPPVESGGVFRELSELFGIRLEKSMRVESRELLDLAEAVNRGELPPNSPLLPWCFDHNLRARLYEKIDPPFFAEEPDPADCLKRLNHFRVLGALRQGPFGTDALNRQILEQMHLQIPSGKWWAVPILITSNYPDRDLYNGSSGVLIGKNYGGSVAYFPHRSFRIEALPPFEIAFCLSIHKSQGSEFENVLALFPEGSEHFGKETVYTAVTRAKIQFEMVAETSTLKAMLQKRSLKASGLKDRFAVNWRG